MHSLHKYILHICPFAVKPTPQTRLGVLVLIAREEPHKLLEYLLRLRRHRRPPTQQTHFSAAVLEEGEGRDQGSRRCMGGWLETHVSESWPGLLLFLMASRTLSLTVRGPTRSPAFCCSPARAITI